MVIKLFHIFVTIIYHSYRVKKNPFDRSKDTAMPFFLCLYVTLTYMEKKKSLIIIFANLSDKNTTVYIK